MREDFLFYYDRELSYLRQLGAEFGKKDPVRASKLRLEPDHCDDPHVERLLESFAFLAARLHLRIDDEFPEITGALLEELYPNFTRPVPSVSLVEFQIDPEKGKATAGQRIERGAEMQSRPSSGFVCKFRTCYETKLWPLTVEAASWRGTSNLPAGLVVRTTAAVLELQISCMSGVAFPDLDLSRLRLHLAGANEVVYPLYELLLSRCHTVLVRDADVTNSSRAFEVPSSSLTPAGFEEKDGLCWDNRHRRGFAGYQILEDYFAFPEKFLFLDFTGLAELSRHGIQKRVSVLFLISPFERMEWRPVLEQGISARSIRLNCTPVVNLFSGSSPVQVKSNVFEMAIPAAPRTEIYSVDRVSAFSGRQYHRYLDSGQGDSAKTESGKKTTQNRNPGYWNVIRRQSRLEGNSSDMFITLVDQRGAPSDVKSDTLTVGVTCTNRDWPGRLPIGDPKGDFQMPGHPEFQKIICLRHPTQGAPAMPANQSFWRLISQLSLNHLSLVDGGEKALQALLRIHDLAKLSFGEENIQGIMALESKPHFARVESEHGVAFVRGKRVELTIDEERFAGSGVFLFGSVLERFLGLYTSLNSFSQLAVKSRLRANKTVHVWPARAGAKVVA